MNGLTFQKVGEEEWKYYVKVKLFKVHCTQIWNYINAMFSVLMNAISKIFLKTIFKKNDTVWMSVCQRSLR
jgi:hypothetical protein